MLGTLIAELGNALAAMRRRPGALAVPVLTMAIGIGASTAIFSALYRRALQSPSVPGARPARDGAGHVQRRNQPWVAAPDFYDYRERAPLLASLSAYLPDARRVTVRQGDGAESVLLTQVSWDLFRTLGVRPAVGREFQAAEGERGGPAVAIVSDGYWKRSLGAARDVHRPHAASIGVGAQSWPRSPSSG